MLFLKQNRLVAGIISARHAIKLVAISVLFGLASCATVNENYNAAKSHHRPDGFQNNYTTATDKSQAEFLHWQPARLIDGLPKPSAKLTSVVAPDQKFVSANIGLGQEPAITWIGHATMLVQMGGLNILTDPVFSDRASPVSFIGPKRYQSPGIALKDLPRIDVVLLSHLRACRKRRLM